MVVAFRYGSNRNRHPSEGFGSKYMSTVLLLTRVILLQDIANASKTEIVARIVMSPQNRLVKVKARVMEIAEFVPVNEIVG